LVHHLSSSSLRALVLLPSLAKYWLDRGDGRMGTVIRLEDFHYVARIGKGQFAKVRKGTAVRQLELNFFPV
jgi:hypothetical protein